MTQLEELIAKHRKLAVAIAGVVVLAVGEAAGVDSSLYSVTVAVLTALGVYGVPNRA